MGSGDGPAEREAGHRELQHDSGSMREGSGFEVLASSQNIHSPRGSKYPIFKDSGPKSH